MEGFSKNLNENERILKENERILKEFKRKWKELPRKWRAARNACLFVVRSIDF